MADYSSYARYGFRVLDLNEEHMFCYVNLKSASSCNPTPTTASFKQATAIEISVIKGIHISWEGLFDQQALENSLATIRASVGDKSGNGIALSYCEAVDKIMCMFNHESNAASKGDIVLKYSDTIEAGLQISFPLFTEVEEGIDMHLSLSSLSKRKG